MEFIINNNISVVPGKNLVNGRKVESRHMKLLCLLVENRGRVVSREEISEKIWEGYGGAGDAMTQAVSFLRKILDDRDRQIIETISKGGYMLNASVSEPVSDHDPRQPSSSRRSKRKTFFALFLILLVAVVIIVWLTRKNRPLAPAAPLPHSTSQPAPAPER